MRYQVCDRQAVQLEGWLASEHFFGVSLAQALHGPSGKKRTVPVFV